MQLKNQSQFELFTDRIFHALADAFPVPITINFQDLGLAEGPAFEDTHGGGQVKTSHISSHLFGTACLRFLTSEGFVNADIRYADAANVVLTGAGLELFKINCLSLNR